MEAFDYGSEITPACVKLISLPPINKTPTQILRACRVPDMDTRNKLWVYIK